MTNRRDVLAGMAVSTTLMAAPAVAASRRPALIAGTYAGKGGAGLYPIDSGGRVGTAIATLPDTSFGVSHGGRRYLVREKAQGRLIATDRAGRILADLSSGGDDPCHVAIDRTGARLAIANYSSGTVAVYPIDRRSGVPGAPVVRQQAGKGPDSGRQEGPHAHWVGFSPDNRFLHAVDLGADAILTYDFTGAVPSEPRVAWRAEPGAGPRHLVRHPRLPVAYVATELANTLVTLNARRDGGFTTRSSVSLLPTGFSGKSQAAHIAIDAAGRRLYVSNRGHNSIAVFDLARDGTPRLVQHIASGGDWPRFFLLLEESGQMLVAHERSGTIAGFRLLPDGRLAATGERIAVPGVVFLDRA